MQQLLKELFAAYYQDVYRYLYSLCRDAVLTEDLVGEVFLEVVRSIASFRRESDVKTWLFSIARHRWMAYLRKKKRRPEEPFLLEETGDSADSLENWYLDREEAERIQSLLSQEPERTRKIVRLRMEGYSFYEIGRICGISENSARVIVFRVRTRIRKILEKEGFADE